MKNIKTLLAAFIALFVVLSPAAQIIFSNSKSPAEKLGTKEQEVYPINDVSLVGQEASFPKMEGITGKVRPETFKGKTLVLYLWSTWCPECPKGMWFMNQLYMDKKNTDLAILAANIGFRDRREEVKYFLKRRHLKLPVAACTPDIMAQFNVKGIPAAFIIDRQGIIRHEDLGRIDEEEFKEKLKAISQKEAKPQQPVEAQ